ncbi:magnesium-transporting ATPase (P-type) [Desulfohalotomaculum tongense]|nr:magnesium-transporting ATPase (P-type) [Desulforadius tongensis]
MNFILDNPSKYLYLLTFLYFIFTPHFYGMNNEKKNIFFNILSKTQLISIFFLLIISSINISNNFNLVDVSYLYFIITVNIVIALAVFYFRLDNFIDNIFKRYIGKNLFIK